MSAKTNQIVGVLFAVLNVLWIIHNAHFFFAYRFQNVLWLYMVPDWQLIANITISFIGLFMSWLLFKNRLKMKLFLIIEAIFLLLVSLLEQFYLIF
jgi:hypothetical protein